MIRLEPAPAAAYAGRMSTTASKRLTQDDWITAGLHALHQRGPDFLRAEPLAEYVGVTKGSFYWHFKDVPAFHESLLQHWEEQVLGCAEAVDAGTTTARLRRLCQTIAGDVEDPAPLATICEPAIRAWARSNAMALESVARTDAQRLNLLQGLLADTGIRNPEMARILYAASTGMAALEQAHAGQNVESIGSLVDLVLALR